MVRVSVLLCLVLLVTLGVVISVSFAHETEVKSKDLESHKKEKSGGEVDGDHHAGSGEDEKVEKKGHENNNEEDAGDKKKHEEDKEKHKDKKKGEHDDDMDDDTDDDTNDDDDDDNADDDKDEVDGDENEKENIGLYELKKENLTVKFTNWGASIMSLHFPDKNGKIDDIVLGYDSVETYKVYFGATVGRVANRIEKAQFKLNGKDYKTSANDGKNTLHGK